MFINFLETYTTFLDKLTKEYHLDDKIAFPDDYKENLTNFEAEIGLYQLDYYDKIVLHKRKIASLYNKLLANKGSITLPPIIEGATYSHYVVTVRNKEKVLKLMRKKNIQLGELIQYSLPKLKSFQQYSKNNNYKNSFAFSKSTINLPINFYITEKKAKLISNAIMNEDI